jgi:large subunit ribosomal protein L23
MSKTVFLRPRLNEKTYALSNKGVYVFDVDGSVNKHTVARAVEAQFDVKVTEVNTSNMKGKAKRIISINGKRMVNAEGKRPNFKKAYVTLAEGQSLPFFDAVEEAAEQEQKAQEQFDKAASKQAEKEAKPARRGIRRKKDEENA